MIVKHAMIYFRTCFDCCTELSMLDAEVLLNATSSRALWTSNTSLSRQRDWTQVTLSIPVDAMSTAEFIFRGYPTHGDAISLKSIDLQIPASTRMDSLRLISATGGQIRVKVALTNPSEPVGVLKAFVREAGSSFPMKLAYTGAMSCIICAVTRFNAIICNRFRRRPRICRVPPFKLATDDNQSWCSDKCSRLQ